MTPCRLCGDTSNILGQRDSGVGAATGDPRRELEGLNSRIAQVEMLLKQLGKGAAVLKKRINQQFSPILRLPHEIISEIFEACLPEVTWSTDVTGYFRDIVPFATMPLLIGKICGAWRDLAWSTPKLWCSISLDLINGTSQDVELLNEWLSRSGRSPLSIQLKLEPDKVRAVTFVERSALRIIADCCERWREVCFVFPASFYEHFEGIRDRLPMLSTLCLAVGVEMSYEGYFQYFKNAPQLRHIKLSGRYSDLTSFPLNRVATVWLGIAPAEHCLEMLRSPVVSHCTFKYIFINRNGIPLPRVVSQVKYLEFGTVNADISPVFLDPLSLPLLKELRMDMDGGLLPLSSLTSLISRSACLLQRLALTQCKCDAAELQVLFAAIPTLVELEIYFVVSINSVFQLLDISDKDSQILLPNLRALTLVDQEGPNFSDVASILVSRWRNEDSANNVARLSSVMMTFDRWTFCVPNTIEGEVLALLNQLIEEGMNISIKDHAGGVIF